jgi:hypothetical protein
MIAVLIPLLSYVYEKPLTCWPHLWLQVLCLPHLQSTESAHYPPSFSRLLEQAVPRTLHLIAMLKLRIKYQKAQLSYRPTSSSVRGKDLAAVNNEWSWNHITRVCLHIGLTKCAGHGADKTSKEKGRGSSTHLLTYLLHLQSPPWEANQFLSQSRNFPHFMQPEGACISAFTNAATCPYPEPDRSRTCPHIPLS